MTDTLHQIGALQSGETCDVEEINRRITKAKSRRSSFGLFLRTDSPILPKVGHSENEEQMQHCPDPKSDPQMEVCLETEDKIPKLMDFYAKKIEQYKQESLEWRKLYKKHKLKFLQSEKDKMDAKVVTEVYEEEEVLPFLTEDMRNFIKEKPNYYEFFKFAEKAKKMMAIIDGRNEKEKLRILNDIEEYNEQMDIYCEKQRKNYLGKSYKKTALEIIGAQDNSICSMEL